jgi:hypothetical protein
MDEDGEKLATVRVDNDPVALGVAPAEGGPDPGRRWRPPHLPGMDGHGSAPRVKNDPALAGHGAEAVRDAIAEATAACPSSSAAP